jgi:hypothetical protein
MRYIAAADACWDPWARIIAMPSHYHVSNETALPSSLLDAATPTAQTTRGTRIRRAWRTVVQLYRCCPCPGAGRDTSCVRARSRRLVESGVTATDHDDCTAIHSPRDGNCLTTYLICEARMAKTWFITGAGRLSPNSSPP